MMTRDSFESSLNNALEFWGGLSSTEIYNYLGSYVLQMVHYDQKNPHHCYDLFTHTLITVDGIPNNATILLKVAAFFHDIGKPSVAFEKDDRLVFYGHAKKSVEITTPILKKLGYSSDEITRIGFYIGHHDDFISWVPQFSNQNDKPYIIPITLHNLSLHIRNNLEETDAITSCDCLSLWSELLTLCEADASAQADTIYQNNVCITSTRWKKTNRIAEIKQLLSIGTINLFNNCKENDSE